MKSFEGIVWTRENILPILKQADEEYYGESNLKKRKHMVCDLDTYYYQPIVNGKDGKKHRVCIIHFISEKNAHSWGEKMRNNPRDFLWLNGNYGDDMWGCFYDDLSEEDKDKLFEILNNPKYKEEQMKINEEYEKRCKEFVKEYDDICKKYRLKFQSDDPYCGLEIVEC